MKYALIGCGRIAVNHIKAALNNRLEIVAVCDVLPEKMDALLAKYDLAGDPSIKRYTDYRQMLSENELTLVSIATESGLHAQIALDCIDAGVNVIIEKPMAMSMADAEEIIRRSDARGSQSGRLPPESLQRGGAGDPPSPWRRGGSAALPRIHPCALEPQPGLL
mgnify:CR=1 FL=1